MYLEWIGFVLLGSIGLAQGTASEPKFAVASIKKNPDGGENGGAFIQPGGRFGARNVTLRFLIRGAWDVKDFQISGGPPWINADRFDVTAKAPEDSRGSEQMRPMLQALLADRFGLVLHRETKELPVYELVPAKGGLKLTTPRDGSCATRDPKIPRPREAMPFCDNIRTGKGRLEAYGVVMSRLAAALSDATGRTVVDRTGFTGIFDGHLEFSPEEVTSGPAPDSSGPSIFTAVQEQLGLKLESAKGQVEILVIDHAEKPSEN
jgi:uncharacterized protein (TIGR03435 family)